jgi:hypothetical protein
VHAYHANPESLGPILAKYEVELPNMKPRDLIESYMNVPQFILPPDFDAVRDVPQYDWDKKFMKVLRTKLRKPEMQRKIKRADFAFDVVAAGIIMLHYFICFPAMYFDLLPSWVLVLGQVLIRTALAAVGHYHCHRRKDGIHDWADCFFDIQYVGASEVLFDGHVMLHHLYTETPADVKRTVFNFVLTLPRIWRVPLFSLTKFGEFFSGHLIRIRNFEYRTLSKAQRFKEAQLIVFRCIMLAEFFWALFCFKWQIWCLQFFCTVWLNMFLIVASHDFEVVREDQSYVGLDWGIFQVQHALDTYITGVQAVDLFLSAGLSCHRVHHCLPYQKSGFANIVSLPAVKSTCEEFGVEWAPARNLILDRWFPLMWYYLTAPAQVPASPVPIQTGGPGFWGFVKEHMVLRDYRRAVLSIWWSFTGASI